MTIWALALPADIPIEKMLAARSCALPGNLGNLRNLASALATRVELVQEPQHATAYAYPPGEGSLCSRKYPSESTGNCPNTPVLAHVFCRGIRGLWGIYGELTPLIAGRITGRAAPS